MDSIGRCGDARHLLPEYSAHRIGVVPLGVTFRNAAALDALADPRYVSVRTPWRRFSADLTRPGIGGGGMATWPSMKGFTVGTLEVLCQNVKGDASARWPLS